MRRRRSPAAGLSAAAVAAAVVFAPGAFGQAFFTVNSSSPSGACFTTGNGLCFTDGSGNHGNDERCTITVLRPVELTVGSGDFVTEPNFDVLSVNGRSYSGNTASPAGEVVAAGDNITWSSDGSVTSAGFTVCGAHPTAALTVASATPSGACFTTASGSCVTDGAGDYNNSERCTIRVLQDSRLSVSEFLTESNYDYLTVNGVRYSGTSHPGGVVVAGGSTIVWLSDTSITRSGWTVCAQPLMAAVFRCDFGSGSSCNMSLAGRWVAHSGGASPSSGTGPLAGLSGEASDGYLLLETSGSGSITSVAETPALALPNGGVALFYYHMYGVTMGSLNVQSCVGTTCAQRFIRSGQQHSFATSPWTLAEIALPAGTTSVRFVGTFNSSSFTGDVSVDSIAVFPNNASASTTTPAPTAPAPANLLWACDFNGVSACDFNASGRWAVGSGPTTSDGTGPDAGQEGTQSDGYAFLETSPSHSGDVSHLTTPSFPSPTPTVAFVSFYFHAYGTTVGNLTLESEALASTLFAPLWSVSGEQHASSSAPWTLVTVSLPAGTTRLRFVGTYNGSFTGDIAVDTIFVGSGTPGPTAPPVSAAPTAMPTAAPTGPPTNRIFSVTNSTPQGACTTNANGTCVTDGAGNHGNNERCTISVLVTSQLSVPEFLTESYYDFLVINNRAFWGSSSPAGLVVGAGQTIQWYSDSSITYPGWTLCATPVQTTAPTAAPTLAGERFGCRFSTGSGNVCGIVADGRWAFIVGATPSWGTGPASGQGGSNDGYAYLETSGSGNTTSHMTSPEFVLDSPGFATFWFHMHGATVGSLTFRARTAAAVVFSDLWSQHGEQHLIPSSNWSRAVVPLAAGTVQVQWVATYGGDYTGDIAVDSISVAVGALPPTPAPTAAAPRAMVFSSNAPPFETGRLWCNNPPVFGSTQAANLSQQIGNPLSPERVFSFVAHRGFSVTLSTCGSFFDTQLGVYNYTGREYGNANASSLVYYAALDDPSPPVCGLSAELSTTVGAGVYAVVVEGPGNAQGAFSLSAACPPEERGQVFVGVPASGDTRTGQNVLGEVAPDHLYTLLVVTTGEYTFDVCNASFDTVVRVFDFDMTQLRVVDDGGCPLGVGNGFQSRFTMRLTRGEYVIAVEGFAQSAGRYQLRVEPVVAASTSIYQGDIACSSEAAGTIDVNTNRYHQYSFSAPTNGIYVIDACGTPGRLDGGLDSDSAVLAVYSGNQSAIAAMSLLGTADRNSGSSVCPLTEGGVLMRPRLELNLTAGVYSVIVNSTARSGTYNTNLQCPLERVGSIVCPEGAMLDEQGATLAPFAAFFDNTTRSVFGNTRYSVNGTQRVQLDLDSSVDFDVRPCTRSATNLSLCCSAQFRVVGVPTLNGTTPLSSAPVPMWQGFCATNDTPVSTALRIPPGRWHIEVRSPYTAWSFSYSCPAANTGTNLVCNQTRTTLGSEQLSAHRFVVPVSGQYAFTLCASGGASVPTTTSAVLHAGQMVSPYCTGVQCCSSGVTVQLTEGSAAYVEIDSPALGVNYSFQWTCPGFYNARVVAPDLSMWVPQPDRPMYGVPQVLSGGAEWRTVCEDGAAWTGEDANVACRMMGFQGGVRAMGSHPSFNALTAQTAFAGNTSCTGNESSLYGCGDALLRAPGACTSIFPQVRCMDMSRATSASSTAVLRPRQLECGGEVVKSVQSEPHVFGLPGGDSVAYFVLPAPQTVVLSTCESESSSDIYLWQFDAGSNTTALLSGVLDFHRLRFKHSCVSGECTNSNNACGDKAVLGGPSRPLQLPAGTYLALAEFQMPAVGLITMSLSCAPALNDSSLRIRGALDSASTVSGRVEKWNVTAGEWYGLRDRSWTKQDSQVVCNQLGFDSGRLGGNTSAGYTEVAPNCRSTDPDLDSCPLDNVNTNTPFQDAYVMCSDRRSITVANRSVIAAQRYWGLPTTAVIGITFTTDPVSESIFSNVIGDRVTFRLDVVDDPLYVRDAGDFLVNPATGSILGSPRREGLIELVLKARDAVGFETVVYSRRVTLVSRAFGLNADSGWSPDFLPWPSRWTVNESLNLFGPSEYGWSNDRLFVNHNLTDSQYVRWALDYENDDAPGDVFINVDSGDMSTRPVILGRGYQAKYTATTDDGSFVVVKNWTFDVLEPDTYNASHGPGNRGCEFGVPVDEVKLDFNFTCRCLVGYTGPNCDAVVSAPVVSARAADDNTMWVYVAVAAAVVCAVLVFLLVKYRKRTKVVRHRRHIVEYIKALGRIDSYSHFRFYHPTHINAVNVARKRVLPDIQVFCPHVEVGPGRRFQLPRRIRSSAHEDAGWTSPEPTAAQIEECNGAIFLAIELGNFQELIPSVVESGADCTMKHPETLMLAHSYLLSQPGPILFQALLALFSRNCSFDDAIGIMLKKGKLVKVVDTNGNPVDCGGGAARRRESLGELGPSPSKPRRRESAGQLTLPSESSKLATWSSRKSKSGSMAKGMTLGSLLETDPDAVTVTDVLRTILFRLATERWRSPDARGDTVVHCVLAACSAGRLNEEVAMDLLEAILTADPSLLVQENARGVSPARLALDCQGCPRIEQTFTIVLFNHFQLLSPNKPRYKSETALLYECRDLRGPEEDTDEEETLVIKLMREKDNWQREIVLRQEFTVSESDVVAIKCAATLHPEAVDFESDVPIEACPGLDEQVRLRSTAVLLKQFPYALVMPMADRNLAEVIQSERLAEESLDVIRHCGFRIGSAIQGLHSEGVVHADIKPRNIVREGATDFKLIDLDMSFAWGVEEVVLHHSSSVGSKAHVANRAGSLGSRSFKMKRSMSLASRGERETFHLAARAKIRASTAYTCPELIRYMGDLSPDAQRRVEDTLATAFRIDIWSFAVTLYEMATGLALFEHQYDRATPAALDQLRQWGGLTEAHIAPIYERFGVKESAALVDLLKWLLDPVAHSRPADFSGVLAHLFFNPKHGAMREHAAVELIRQQLENRKPGERMYKKVFISYSWADTAFVLNQLAPELAPLVEDLWLDRLGGEHGMGEWTGASMEMGVLNADVVIAVVSEAYVQSTNCGFEMDMCAKHRKTTIPLNMGIPFAQWPPVTIGQTKMHDQFRNPETGDMKLFIDFSDVETFSVKFNQELLPRLQKPVGAANKWRGAAARLSRGSSVRVGKVARFQSTPTVHKLPSVEDDDVSAPTVHILPSVVDEDVIDEPLEDMPADADEADAVETKRLASAAAAAPAAAPFYTPGGAHGAAEDDEGYLAVSDEPLEGGSAAAVDGARHGADAGDGTPAMHSFTIDLDALGDGGSGGAAADGARHGVDTSDGTAVARNVSIDLDPPRESFGILEV